MPSAWAAAIAMDCAIPAAIGVAFVAPLRLLCNFGRAGRGPAAAALYGVSDVAASPAPPQLTSPRATATLAAGWRLSCWDFLLLLAIIEQWTHTLGAIAQRSVGTEAAAAKAEGRRSERPKRAGPAPSDSLARASD